MTIQVNEAPIKQFFLDPERTKLSPVAIMFLNQLARVAQGKDWSAVKAADSLLLNGHADTYFATAADLTAQVPHYGRVSGSDFTTGSTSLVDIAGLSVALAANSVYAFSAHLVAQSSSLAGLKWGLNYSAAGATLESTFFGGRFAGTNMLNPERVTAFNTPSAVYLNGAAPDTGSFYFNGVIVTGANAGNFTVQALKVTSGTAKVYISSFLEVTKIP